MTVFVDGIDMPDLRYISEHEVVIGAGININVGCR
jgi:hypothetical protein